MAARVTQQHAKIARYLRELISSGALSPGDLLPSEAELCERFDSSRGPVRQAMATLRTEGAISSGRGRRSVVLGNYNAESFEATYCVTEWLRAQGVKPGQQTLWLARRPAPANAARSLRLEEGEPLIFVHRIRYANGAPVMIERQYFPLSVGRKLLDFDADNGSIHAFLHDNGVDIDNVHRTLSLEMAAPEDADALEVQTGTPLMALNLDISNQAGLPVEYAEYLYRPDRLQLSMTTVRGGNSPLEVLLLKNED
ncbi:GntR family transcriptional regulator [Corynebacterium camporealensis]|uniref:Transcriptional regulator n=1 Tax=Corynebacterium camporealensis TaxID=161896 RepID=A0A0F6QWY0_9CORY|nr:GntR family transcriptional regulator [Corynebacterium camporealensis]AKE39672.1 transcriptional regulator [Corynebacterium camporealensis]